MQNPMADNEKADDEQSKVNHRIPSKLSCSSSIAATMTGNEPPYGAHPHLPGPALFSSLNLLIGAILFSRKFLLTNLHTKGKERKGYLLSHEKNILSPPVSMQHILHITAGSNSLS